MDNIFIFSICSVLISTGLMGFDYSNAEEYLIPEWIKNNAGWWAGDSIGDSDFVLGVDYLIEREILVVNTSNIPNDFPIYLKENAAWWANGDIDDGQFLEVLKDWIEGTHSSDDIDDIDDKEQNNEINFKGSLGPLINCETVSYKVYITVQSTQSVPVVIEIIDPAGNIAGTDSFQSGEYEQDRIIEMNWGGEGKYLIQIQYKGYTYEDFTQHSAQSLEVTEHDKKTCLTNQYFYSGRDNAENLFIHATTPTYEGFFKNIKIAEELLVEANAAHLIDLISEKTIREIITHEKPVFYPPEIQPAIPELQSILSKGVEPRVIAIFEESENNIANDPNFTIDEKAEIILVLREIKDATIKYQKRYAAEWIDGVYKNVYVEAEKYQRDLEAEANINYEKEKIIEELISKSKSSEAPEKKLKGLRLLQQTAMGILPENVTCPDGFYLIFKSADNSPACVKQSTAQKLLERGWTG